MLRKSPKPEFSRPRLMTFFLLAVGVLLLCRIFIMQSVGYEKYQGKVIEQITTESPVRAERGTIYDRNGKILASNITAYRLFISPSDIAEAQKDRKDTEKTQAEMIAAGIAELIGDGYYDKIINEAKKTSYLDRTIMNNIIDDKIIDGLLAFISENDLSRQVYLDAGSMRYYPYGTLACHLIGFCSSDGVGLYGLEYEYNNVLAGVNGKTVTARDAYGNEMNYDYESYVAAIDGSDLYTTIDIDVQLALDEQCEQSLINTGARNGTCGIVMDPDTGGILAMSSAPAFDLNSPWTLVDYYQKQLDEYAESNSISADSTEYDKMRTELRLQMWANKAITEAFIPGSTFKIITSAMTLDNKVVTDPYMTDGRFYCAAKDSGRLGGVSVGGVTIHCHSLHGAQCFAEGLMNSCNVTFVNLGQAIGKDAFYTSFKSFGYLNKTGIDLPGEGTSIMHTYENMKVLELATSAFGQNFKITGIQHVTAVNAVVNGGDMLEPFVVSRVVDANGTESYSHGRVVVRSVASAGVCETLRTILEECVSGGYGGKNCYVPGYRVAAKTGTSEKVGDDRDLRIGSVMAFAPAEKPVATAMIMCDEPDPKFGSTYGSTVAAPYMQALMEQILPALGVEANYTEAEAEDINTKIPSFVGWSVSAVEKYIESWYGINYEIIGEGSVIRAQYPEKGTYVVEKNAKLVLYTSVSEVESNMKKVPDVTGMQAAAAIGTLVNAGFNIRVVGSEYFEHSSSATVQSQLPGKSTILEKGGVVTLYFNTAPEDVDAFPDAGEAVG